jgi:anaerobic ribonucleoside-triphosphate reductase
MTEESGNATQKVKAVRTEVYSRVVGYYRPVQDWNRGKQEEFAQREYIDITKDPEDGEKRE